MFGAIVGVLATIATIYAIIKKYNQHAVLYASGLSMMALATIFSGKSVLGDKTTGSVIVDLFQFITNTASSQLGGLGLIVMSVAGFAVYMDHIGASRRLASLAIRPLQRLNRPYLVLGLTYTVGQILNIFIPSASGLALLMIVTMFPILLALGIPRLSAAAVIVTTACLDLGPASGNANLAAKTAGIDVAVYFVRYQIPVAIAVIIGITVLHIVVQKYYDKKDIANGTAPAAEEEFKYEEQEEAPLFYALLPIFPLALLLTFSSFTITTVKMNVVTAMFIGLTLSMICEAIRRKNGKVVLASIKVFFDGMGRNLALVVTLIVAGRTFAQGLTQIGLIGYVIETTKGMGFGIEAMMIVMTLIIAVTSIITGSGNAAFFAFAPLAPTVATAVGANPIIMLLPMQLVSGIARSASPILAATIAVAGIVGVNTFDVAKRALIPMMGGTLITIIMTILLV